MIEAGLSGEVADPLSPVAASEVGVRRVPVPRRGDRRCGALVPAVQPFVSGRGGTAGRTGRRGRSRHRLSVGAAVHTTAGRRRPIRPPLTRRQVVHRRDVRQGQRGVALRVPGDRPARAGHRRARLVPPRRRWRAQILPAGALDVEGHTQRGNHRRRRALPSGAG